MNIDTIFEMDLTTLRDMREIDIEAKEELTEQQIVGITAQVKRRIHKKGKVIPFLRGLSGVGKLVAAVLTILVLSAGVVTTAYLIHKQYVPNLGIVDDKTIYYVMDKEYALTIEDTKVVITNAYFNGENLVVSMQVPYFEADVKKDYYVHYNCFLVDGAGNEIGSEHGARLYDKLYAVLDNHYKINSLDNCKLVFYKETYDHNDWKIEKEGIAEVNISDLNLQKATTLTDLNQFGEPLGWQGLTLVIQASNEKDSKNMTLVCDAKDPHVFLSGISEGMTFHPETEEGYDPQASAKPVPTKMQITYKTKDGSIHYPQVEISRANKDNMYQTMTVDTTEPGTLYIPRVDLRMELEETATFAVIDNGKIAQKNQIYEDDFFTYQVSDIVENAKEVSISLTMTEKDPEHYRRGSYCSLDGRFVKDGENYFLIGEFDGNVVTFTLPLEKKLNNCSLVLEETYFEAHGEFELQVE